MTYELPSVHEVRPDAEVRTIAVRGEIDPGVVINLQRGISRALALGHRRMVIDLSAVTLLGAQTSLMLGGALRRLTSRGATLAVAAPPESVRRVLDLHPLDGIAMYPDLSEALSALAAGPTQRARVTCTPVPRGKARRDGEASVASRRPAPEGQRQPPRQREPTDTLARSRANGADPGDPRSSAAYRTRDPKSR